MDKQHHLNQRREQVIFGIDDAIFELYESNYTAMNIKETQKQIHEIVIDSTALYFGISVDQLKNDKMPKYEAAYRRHVCFYLIRKNSDRLSREFIADIFNIGKSTVEHGENKIASELTIYRRTMGDVKDIQDLIDNFRKNLQQSWLTQSSN